MKYIDNMPKASEKTKDNLYKIADRTIMDARIEIQKVITDHRQLEKVDEILFRQCPKTIINYFE